MRSVLINFSYAIDAFISGIGRVVSFTVLVILFVIILDMTVRMVMGRSLDWVVELNAWMQVTLVFLGGPYALSKGSFVRVDALYANYSDLAKAIFDTIVTTSLFAIFAWVLIKLGSDFALNAYKLGERPNSGGFDAPVWIVKSMIPMGGVLLVLVWASILIKQWLEVHSPREGN